jgi:hypothetical protein
VTERAKLYFDFILNFLNTFILLDALITYRTRLKLLLRFFLNASASSYLHRLEEEFGESTKAIRVELNRLEEAVPLNSELVSNRKIYKAKTSHPLFQDINNIIRKYSGLDKLVEEVLAKLGNVKEVNLTSRLARRLNSDVINLLVVSDGLDVDYLDRLVTKASEVISKKTYLITTTANASMVLEDISDKLLLYRP